MSSTESADIQEAGASHVAAAQDRSLSTGVWLVLLCWPIVVATAAMYWSGKQQAQAIAEVAASRPEVAVIDDLALIELVINRGADASDPRALFEGIKKVVEENGLESTVLLSESMVMHTPDQSRIVIRKEQSPAVREIR